MRFLIMFWKDGINYMYKFNVIIGLLFDQWYPQSDQSSTDLYYDLYPFII